MNCAHPIGAPILDCCGEEVGDLPLYIYCSLPQFGHKFFKFIDGSAQTETFLRLYSTTVFNAAAKAAGCTDGSYESIIDIKTGIQSVTEVPAYVPSDDAWFKLSEIQTGLPNPLLTIVWQNQFFSARIRTDQIAYTNPNTAQTIIDRVNSVMAGKDFSGLDPNQSPAGFQYNRNCKVVDWDGNESITHASYWGPMVRILNADETYSQKSATSFYHSGVTPTGKTQNYFSMQKLRALPGSYSVKSYINAIPTQAGTLVNSTEVAFEGTRVFDPPAWPDTALWNELERQAIDVELFNYNVLIPLPP